MQDVVRPTNCALGVSRGDRISYSFLGCARGKLFDDRIENRTRMVVDRPSLRQNLGPGSHAPKCGSRCQADDSAIARPAADWYGIQWREPAGLGDGRVNHRTTLVKPGMVVNYRP